LAFTSPVHVPTGEGLHDFNPGIYAFTADGLVVGAYNNSVNRLSFYVGDSIERGPFRISGGLISGYQRKPAICVTALIGPEMKVGQVCGAPGSGTPGVVVPFISPSAALPSFLGVVPRISVMPGWCGGSTAVHLSIEKPFSS
jgi:hypothetical protein